MQGQVGRCYDILYFEAYDHVVLMHTKENETYQCVESLKDLAKRLQDKGFVFTSRSYLVNIEHIRKVEKNMVRIAENHELSLSRSKCTEIRKLHFEWKMCRTNG